MKRERDKQINFRLSEEELDKFNENVIKSKLKKSEYLRRCILEKDIIVIEDMKEVILELKQIRSSLDKSINKEDVNKDEIYDIKQKLNDVFAEAVITMRKVNQ